MAVTPARVDCAAGDWTLIASSVPKIMAVFLTNPNIQGFVMPSANKPNAKTDLQPWVPVTGQANSVFNDDGTTNWWFWSDVATSVTVWKL